MGTEETVEVFSKKMPRADAMKNDVESNTLVTKGIKDDDHIQ